MDRARRRPRCAAYGARPARSVRRRGVVRARAGWIVGRLDPAERRVCRRAATGYSLDLPGSGRSDPPPGGRYSPLLDADLVGRTIEQVAGGPVHLVGNSYGGLVATLLAARRPELVRTLTLISPAVPDLRLTTDRGADPRLGLLLLPGTARLAHQRLSTIAPMARARGMGELCFGHPELDHRRGLRGRRAGACPAGDAAVDLPGTDRNAARADERAICGSGPSRSGPRPPRVTVPDAGGLGHPGSAGGRPAGPADRRRLRRRAIAGAGRVWARRRRWRILRRPRAGCSHCGTRKRRLPRRRPDRDPHPNV